MSKVTIDNLFWNLITNETLSICNHDKYHQWENETENLKSKLNKRGKIDVNPKTWEVEQYWGNDAPIVLTKYPYHSCEVYQCIDCKEFFFHYIEDGGHGSQKRYRIINVDLIDKKDYIPTIRSTIEYKSYDYSVAKYPDGVFELVTIRHDVGIGIDILHKLNNAETSDYLNKGINALKERIEDMKKNYNNYKITSWR